MIRTASIYDPADQAQGLRVLVMRYFQTCYRAEIEKERPQVIQQLRQLEEEHGTLTLLCRERMPPHAHCHRELLRALLRKSSRKASP